MNKANICSIGPGSVTLLTDAPKTRKVETKHQEEIPSFFKIQKEFSKIQFTESQELRAYPALAQNEDEP